MSEKARIYRKRAEKLRSIGQGWRSEESRKTLFEIAHDYERMAEAVENGAVPFCEPGCS